MRTISFENLDKFIPQSPFEEKVAVFSKNWFSLTQTFSFNTSGSTGVPKSIELSRKQMEASANQTIEWLGLKQGQRALLCLSPDYIAGAMVLVRAFLAKMDVVLLEPAQDLVNHFIANNTSIHLASFVPNQWKLLLESPIDLNSSFQNASGVLIGGADLDLKSKWLTQEKCQFPVFLTYGMTETVSHIAFQALAPIPTDYLQTLPEVKIEALDGCLSISSPSTLFEKVQTQDLVEILDQTRFRIMGRANRIINAAGFKINPTEIEALIAHYLMENQLNFPFFVAGVADSFYGEKVALFVETTQFIELNAINKYLLQLIDKKKLPKQLFVLPSFVYTSTGKINPQQTIALALESYA